MNLTMPGMLRHLSDVFERRAKRNLALATLGSIVVATLDTIAIALVLPLVDLATGADVDSGAVGFISDLLGNPDRRTLAIILAVGVVVLFILKDLGSMAFNWWMMGFIFTERVKTSARVLRHFLTSPWTQVSRRSSAELLRTMDASVMQVFNYTVNGLMFAVSNSIAIVAIVVALVFVAPLPTLAVVVYFGLAAFVYVRLVRPRATAAGVEMAEASVVGWRTALAALGGIKEISLRGTQDHFVRNYQAAALRGAHAGRIASFLGGLPKYILEILFILAVGIVLLFSSISSSDAAGSAVGILALFVAAGFRVLPSITGLLGNVSSIKVGGKSLEIVHDEILAARRAVVPPEEDGVPLGFRRTLRVEDVTFRYPGSDADVLTAVSLEVPRGTSVAFVGGSGAGKTTLVDVILGLHDPRSGRVTVDGIDIAGRKAGWHANVGYVAQDVYVLDATLAENIAFDKDREDIDEELLAGVIRQAQLDDLVRDLPEGVDTPLGEKGARLSGGQRQRVGIARALYRRPALLVLDEATSALDNETEHHISQTIAGLHGDITVAIVAHRLSTVRHSDQIVFLKDGRVETTGSFDEVCRDNAEFARLVELGSLAPLEIPADGSTTVDGVVAAAVAHESGLSREA